MYHAPGSIEERFREELFGKEYENKDLEDFVKERMDELSFKEEMAKMAQEKQVKKDLSAFMHGFSLGALNKEYDETNPDMKTQYENAEMMCAYAENVYKEDAHLISAIINLSTLARIRQVKETGQMGEYSASYVEDTVMDTLVDCTFSEKVLFALKYLGQENVPTEGVPADFVDITQKATKAKDAVHKSCARYMRDEAERKVHIGKTQVEDKRIDVTREQYVNALKASGYDEKIIASIVSSGFDRREIEGNDTSTTDFYLDIKERGLKSDKFAFMKELDENGKVIPGEGGKGFKNNGFKISFVDYMVFGSDIINQDLFSNDINKVQSAITQLTSPALEHTASNGDKVHETEIALWKELSKDYFLSHDRERFDKLLDNNLDLARGHLKKLQNLSTFIKK